MISISTISEDKLHSNKLMTKRELEVLKLIALGHSSLEISSMLFIGMETVKSHRKNLLRKLNAKNTAVMICTAMYKGILHIN